MKAEKRRPWAGTIALSALWLGIACSLLSTTNRVSAGELSSMLQLAAENVKAILKSQGADTTRLNVTGPAAISTSASSTVTQLLGEQLAKQGIKLGDRVSFAVSVKVKPVTKEMAAGVNIEIFVVDADDERFVDYDLGGRISDPSEVMTLLGLSGSFSDTTNFNPKSARLAADVIKDSLAKPQVSVRDGLARSSPTSPFGVQILVRNGPRPMENRDGFAFATLGFDDEYVIRISNQSHYEVAVAVRIDGLSPFHFSTQRATDELRRGEPKYRYHVIAPRTTADIKGWEIDSARVKAFRIVPREDSLAAKLGIEQEIGVIHVAFHASWSGDFGIPPDEPAARDRGKSTMSGSGTAVIVSRSVRTKIGTEVELKGTTYTVSTYESPIGTTFGSDLVVSTTGVQRTIGFLRDGVSIRYRLPK